MAGKTFNVGSNDENYQKQMIAEEVAKQMPVKMTTVERAEDPRLPGELRPHQGLGLRAAHATARRHREIADAVGDGLIADPYAQRYRNS